MKNTITKNPDNVSILHNLISSGHYKGFINSDNFELVRNHFPNNFRVIGNLNENGKFLVSSDYAKPLYYSVKVFDILGIIVSIAIFILKTNWIIPLLYFCIRLVSSIYSKSNKAKQMQLFTSKFLEFKSVQENKIH